MHDWPPNLRLLPCFYRAKMPPKKKHRAARQQSIFQPKPNTLKGVYRVMDLDECHWLEGRQCLLVALLLLNDERTDVSLCNFMSCALALPNRLCRSAAVRSYNVVKGHPRDGGVSIKFADMDGTAAAVLTSCKEFFDTRQLRTGPLLWCDSGDRYLRGWCDLVPLRETVSTAKDWIDIISSACSGAIAGGCRDVFVALALELSKAAPETLLRVASCYPFAAAAAAESAFYLSTLMVLHPGYFKAQQEAYCNALETALRFQRIENLRFMHQLGEDGVDWSAPLPRCTAPPLLMVADTDDRLPTVRFLCEVVHVDVNIVDRAGWNALHAACAAPAPAVARYLVERCHLDPWKQTQAGAPIDLVGEGDDLYGYLRSR